MGTSVTRAYRVTAHPKRGLKRFWHMGKRRTPKRPAPSTLERAVIASVRDAQWVDTTDQAAVWLLRDVMLALDGTRRQATLDGTLDISPRDLAELAGRAVALLRDLGLTPVARHRLGLWETEVDDAFAQVVRLASASSGSSEE